MIVIWIVAAWFAASVLTGLLVGRLLHRAKCQDVDSRDPCRCFAPPFNQAPGPASLLEAQFDGRRRLPRRRRPEGYRVRPTGNRTSGGPRKVKPKRVPGSFSVPVFLLRGQVRSDRSATLPQASLRPAWRLAPNQAILLSSPDGLSARSPYFLKHARSRDTRRGGRSLYVVSSNANIIKRIVYTSHPASYGRAMRAGKW
jgi:hypothetical protein